MGKLLIVAAALLVPIGAAAHARDDVDPTSGNGLLELCQHTGDYDEGLCDGFISGVADVQYNRYMFCLPPHTKVQQMPDAVMNGLRNHPEERQKPSRDLITKYMRAAFPCK